MPETGGSRRSARRSARRISAAAADRRSARPYESLGFVVVDNIDAWTFGARPEDLAALGAG